MGKVIAVCTSDRKGIQKKDVSTAHFSAEWGIDGDAHAALFKDGIAVGDGSAVFIGDIYGEHFAVPDSVKLTAPNRQKSQQEGTIPADNKEQASHPTGAKNNSRKR